MSKSGYTCIRYLFCILNLVLWLSGCGLLGIGLWLRFGVESFQIKAPWIPVATAIIVLGTLVFVISFFGCCGACYQNKCMLVTYLSLVVIMFLIEFVAATLVFVYREQIHDQVNEEFLNGIHHHYERSTGEGLKEMWDKIHTELNCCGLKGYEDWYDIDAWPGQKNVPDSCCIPNFQNSSGCGAAGNQDKWYSVGCSDRIQMWLVSRLHLVGIAGLLIAFIQLFGLVSAMLLFCTNTSHKRSNGKMYHSP